MFPFINPKTDFAFKKIFGSPQSKDILLSFLNAIIYEGKSVIQDLTILDPYQAPRIEGMKDSFLDIKAELTDGTAVIIEMQVLSVLGFKKRVLYNAAKAFSTQLEAGQDYTLLNPVIALTITDFEMFENSDRIISRYRLKEKEDLTDYSDDIELIFAELPKFTKTIKSLETVTDKWLYFLKSANQLEAVPANLEQVAAIQSAFEIARQSRLTREEMEVLDQQSMVIHDSKNAIRLAEQEGAKKAQVRIARSLLTKLPIETISETTGLTPEEVAQLKSESP